ncbi:hypothetical protein PCASD_17878 [Puccinia coronata f. sp. avenae]|uniref:C2H2-type domain-containing protein n=1 Tax=Puccinia coronata f. sp. avenae TaxID=200324 RepID=A0A2N5U143_9BASI|nr:hypothetical protein PCASD_17878 [Puccinia coronata f. sp. avenae]
MEEGFNTWQSDTSKACYTCNHCGPRLMKEKQKSRHLQSAAHKQKLSQQRDIENTPFGRDHRNPSGSALDIVLEIDVDEVEEVELPHFNLTDNANSNSRPALEEIALSIDQMFQNNDFRPNNNFEEMTDSFPPEIDRYRWIEYEMERIREDLSLDNMEEEADEIVMKTHEWYPFKSKMDLVGLLLVGYTQNLISRSLYNQIQSILNTLCQLKIPAWATVRRSQQRIRMHLQMEIIMKANVWGMPCAILSSKRALQMELANPLVARFLDFYPKDTNGRDQFKLSQCQKWLELPSDLRPQMESWSQSSFT